MPSVRYSFRSSTINAGIASEQRRNESDARREQARARRPVRTVVSASSRMLEHPQNAVMPIASQALASDQLVGGDQPEVTAQVTSVSAVSVVHMPNPVEHRVAAATASQWLVGTGTRRQVIAPAFALSTASDEPLPTSVVAEAEHVATATDPVDASPATGSGIGTKRSSRSPSPLPSDKRRRVERSGSSGEGSSQQVAESSAAAMARATSALQSPAVAGIIDVDVEMSEATAVVSEPPASHLASDMEEVSLLLGLSGDEAAPREAPASPRTLDAAESMLGLGWVQPVPIPLPSPDASSLMTSPPPPPPPQQQPQVPAAVSANDMEAAQTMLGLWSPASLPPPPSPQQEAPPSPRALDAAESLVNFAEGSAAPLSPPPQAPPSPRAFEAAASLFGIARPEEENQVLDAGIALMDILHPAAPHVVSEEEKARRRQFLDANMPASPYNAGMLDRIVGRFDACLICLSAPKEGETMVRILDCRHAFCQECIDTWLQEQERGTCATCRQVYF